MFNTYVRIVYLASKLGVNLLLYGMINTFYTGSFVIAISSLWLAFSLAYLYEEEKRIQHINNMMEKKRK